MPGVMSRRCSGKRRARGSRAAQLHDARRQLRHGSDLSAGRARGERWPSRTAHRDRQRPVTLRPSPPVATRLNRVALGLIGALVAVTAIVAVEYIAGSGRVVRRVAIDSVVTAPQRPSFPVPAAVPATMPAAAPAQAPRQTVVPPTPEPTREAAPESTSGPAPRPVPQPHPKYVTAITQRHGDHDGLFVMVDSLGSTYTLTAGTILPATLITEINSDLPGTVVAQLDRDVYDSRTGRTVLIPRGTRLIGRYDNHLSVGQHRLMVIWTRLVFPDSRELALPDLAAIDAHGAAGLSDVTDDHLPRVFGTALLLSAVGAGAQLSQPTSGSALTTPSASQVAAGAVGQRDVRHRARCPPPQRRRATDDHRPRRAAVQPHPRARPRAAHAVCRPASLRCPAHAIARWPRSCCWISPSVRSSPSRRWRCACTCTPCRCSTPSTSPGTRRSSGTRFSPRPARARSRWSWRSPPRSGCCRRAARRRRPTGARRGARATRSDSRAGCSLAARRRRDGAMMPCGTWARGTCSRWRRRGRAKA